jgi:hypothetical protein
MVSMECWRGIHRTTRTPHQQALHTKELVFPESYALGSLHAHFYTRRRQLVILASTDVYMLQGHLQALERFAFVVRALLRAEGQVYT